MSEERFNVVIFDAEGYHHTILRNVDAETAVGQAKVWTDLGERLGYPDRVIITDADDNTNFLWERGEGVVYPDGLQKRHQERDDDG